MMNHKITLGLVAILSLVVCAKARCADAPPAAVSSTVDEATQKKIDSKSKRLIDAAKIDDPAKAEKVKAIMGTWLVTMWDWHKQNDPELAKLWSEWNKARSVVPKDEFPGEIIAHKIDDAYGLLKPAYQTFLTQLATELTPEQIDAIKEIWSRSPGMTRTYNAYLQIVPDLTEDQKKVIHDRMLMAREAAMLTDSDKEVINLFKIHKVKVEEYIGGLEWAKLHSAFGAKGKAAPGAAKAPATSPAD